MAYARGFLRFCANLGPGIVPGQVTQPMVFAIKGGGPSRWGGGGIEEEKEEEEEGAGGAWRQAFL